MATKKKFNKPQGSLAKKIWAVITIVSVLLNFYLAYLVLLPKIRISYTSDFIPPGNPLVLPLKISNESALPISHMQMFIVNNLVCGDPIVGEVKIYNDRYRAKIQDRLAAGSSYNFVHNDNEVLGVSVPPSGGTIEVELSFKYAFISFSESKTFTPRQSKDGAIRWLEK